METTELPQNRDRREPIGPDELRSSIAKAPSRGLSRLRPWAARYMQFSDGNHFRKGTMPMAIPIETYDDGVFYGAREIDGMGQGHGG